MLLFPIGSAGDVHPFIGLGLALQQRGHDVALFVNEYFRALAEQVGLEYIELGSAQGFLEGMKHPDLWNPRRAFKAVFEIGISQIMRPQFDCIKEFVNAGETVMVLTSALGFGARIAQERYDVPLVTIHLQPSALWSEYDSPKFPGLPTGPRTPRWVKRCMYRLGERLAIDRFTCASTNAFRREVGVTLPAMKRTTDWWHSTQCVLGLFPEWFGAPQPDWPVHVHLSQFPLWDARAATGDQPELAAFLDDDDDAPIVFAPGSANEQAEFFFEAAVGACARLGRRGILLTKYADQIPRSLPDGVRHFDYIPFSRVLPRAAALVHHGGIGTVSQALRAGVPQLVMPLAHDQPDNAERVRRLGVGHTLAPKHFHASAVAKALHALLESSEVRQSCEKTAQRFTSVSDPFEQACAIIEGYGRSRLAGASRRSEPRP